MGIPARRGAGPARPQPDAQPAVLPELRADLVRLHAAGGRPDEDPVQRALAGAGAGAGAALQLLGLRQGVRVSAGLAHEPHEQVQRVVGVTLTLVKLEKNGVLNGE